MKERENEMKKKQLLSALLSAVLVLSLAACGGTPTSEETPGAPAPSQSSAATVDQTREIVFAASRDQCPGEQDAYYASMSLGVWEPLITKDEHGKPAPALSTEWEHNGDSTLSTHELR